MNVFPQTTYVQTTYQQPVYPIHSPMMPPIVSPMNPMTEILITNPPVPNFAPISPIQPGLFINPAVVYPYPQRTFYYY